MIATTLTMTTTGLVVFIGILGLAIYDLACVVWGNKTGKGVSITVSQFLITTAFKAPLVSFAFGCTCGHLFFYMWDASCKFDHVRHFLTAGVGATFGALCTFVVLKGVSRVIK